MAVGRNPVSVKTKSVFGLMLLLLITTISLAFSSKQGDDFDSSRREILLRRIGHELLLQSGDSTSRVLPVKKITENEYQIGFENEFTFQPDALVNITKTVLEKDPLASDYVVNVLNCGNGSVAYGYAISKDKKEDVVACLGRTQPVGCYKITVKFKPVGIMNTKRAYLFGGLSILAVVGFVFWSSVKPRNILPVSQPSGIVNIGIMLFDIKNRKLRVAEKTIELTGTETRLLRIFALSQNQTITRSRLQKEIWEDEGVIVGRSLDMFISKLRKKLESDPNIKIVVIRGKGYRLEIAQENTGISIA